MVLKRIKALLTRTPKRTRSSTATDPATHTAAPPAVVPAAAPASAEAEAPRPAVHRGPAVTHHPVALRELDPDAVRIIKRLTRFDHAAYLVGGCVRDLLLERKPKDFDIGTSATPRQIKRLFSNCRIIGRRFRLAHIYFQSGKIIEVATFRARDAQDPPAEAADAGAEVSDDLLIRDDNVFGTPEEDALRRDFTINALFYDVNAETVIDHAEGLTDLRRKLVRTIGDPATRFREDPIRILRAVKFAARLDFEIERSTLAALRATRGEIPKAAPPRVLEEINRFCRGAAGRRSFELLFETGVFEIVLPELAAVYGDAPPRAVLAALLDALDARVRADLPIATGEIFAALLVAAVAPRLGWSLEPGGRPAGGERKDARDVADDAMRPIAVRLRVSRKDQERTRQAIATLHRLVPAKPMRRGQRSTVLRRPAFADAWWMLEALAPLLGGEFAAAKDAWAPHVGVPGAPVAPSEPGESPETAEQDAPREGRRRRRRGGRGRRREGTESPESGPPRPAPAPSAARPKPAGGKPMPAVWDDNYFFAALPSVPDHAAIDDDAGPDRYGASSVRGAAEPRAAEGPGVTVSEGAENPSRRRRRGRRGGRRHRKGGPILHGDERPTSSEGESS